MEPVKLFQYNTLGALMAGLYGGSFTIGELLEHGDLGVGTLDSIDGELIVLDGKAYQAKGWIFNWLPKTKGDTKRPSMVCSTANTIKTLINISGPATKPNTKAGNMAKKLPK